MTKRKESVRATTGDRGPPGGGPDIHTVEQLGPKMSKMANGNLLCKEVPIARVGWMVYGPGETPIEANPATGWARVYRGEDELFKASCMGSFMGAAITDDHPDEDVTPENWRTLAGGFATSDVYRGSGDDADVLFADIIISDKDLIKAVLDGKREVSCGYDADYVATGVGEGRQENIIGNHIALVEKGRCGPRCAIGDKKFHQPRKETDMATRVQIKTADKRVQLRKALRQAVATADQLLDEGAGAGGEEELEPGEEGGDEGATHIHIHTNGSEPEAKPAVKAEGQDDGEGGEDPTEARFQAIETTLAQLVEMMGKLTGGTGTDDGGEDDPAAAAPVKKDEPVLDEAPDPDDLPADQVKTMDSAALQTSYADLLANVEILVPGFRSPTFDAKAKRKATVDGMCGLRRKAMDTAYATKDGQELIEGVAGATNLDLAKMTCVDVANLFKASVGAKRLINNRAATGDASKLAATLNAGGNPSKVQSIADLNKINADFWAKQTQAA
jgi:hypothetical protein